MSIVEWCVPPPSKNGKSGSMFTSAVLDELRANPGKWALLKKGHSTGTGATGYSKSHPDIETTTRRINGLFDIYARYVGTP